MYKTTISAPGKVILHGEHAVVYKKAAIAASLSLRTTVQLQQHETSLLKIELNNINFIKTWKIEEIQPLLQSTDHTFSLHNPQLPCSVEIQRIKQVLGISQESSDRENAIVTIVILYLLLGRQCSKLPVVDIQVTSTLPIGSGLGSSASFCVCIATSLLLLHDHIAIPKDSSGSTEGTWCRADLNLINTWAYLGEKVIHGTPSGVDNSVATYGGALRFQAGEVTLLDKMPSVRILLVDTKVPRSTKQLVAKVRGRYDKHPSVIDPILESMNALVGECEDIYTRLASADCDAETLYESLEELIDINQLHLCVLDVSHPALEDICHTCARYHLHAKLTGAGGGGCAFCLLRPGTSNQEVQNLKEELESKGFVCFETEVGGSGVTWHQNE